MPVKTPEQIQKEEQEREQALRDRCDELRSKLELVMADCDETTGKYPWRPAP